MSPVIATILLVAMTVVLAAVLYALLSGLANSTVQKTPLGSTLVLGTPLGVNVSGQNWYNVSIQAAGHGLQWGNLAFQVVASDGTPVHLPAGAVANVLGRTGNSIGQYSFATVSWTSGSGAPVDAMDQLSVYSAALALHHDRLIAFGTGPFQGSVSDPIP
ncbi:MAG TPA: archaellin/type IV pilin N-terminal domain-containing protein [Thermoplasmata archaeon]|nr:archaellin/type IV pilin N-terminal domain-containing protein [Thermoplasmata archaeon]